MHKLYGTARQFLDTFNPGLQLTVARHWQRAYRGTAPTLATVAEGYGWPTAEVWLCLQLEDINCFAGVKEKMSVSRQKEFARLCLTEYGHLRVTELMLCFHRLKCGRYGRFYGSVDALFIAAALLQFAAERRHDLARIREDEPRRTDSATESPTAITYAEYLALKKKGGTGDTANTVYGQQPDIDDYE